jgi:hypothetical protein
MKKFILVLFIASMTAIPYSCNTLQKLGSYFLTEQDAVSAIKEALTIGSQAGSYILGQKGSFGKETIMGTIFPPEMQKVLGVLQQLGLSNEVDRFVNTLGTAAEQTALKSTPIFLLGIKNMTVRDAINIVKNGNNAATDYLRNAIGDSLRNSVAPVMNDALNEYKLASEWNKLVAPVKLLTGDKLNLDLGNLMSGLLTNAMFAKIEEKEREIRTRAEARTSSLLQKVFGRDWN